MKKGRFTETPIVSALKKQEHDDSFSLKPYLASIKKVSVLVFNSPR